MATKWRQQSDAFLIDFYGSTSLYNKAYNMAIAWSPPVLMAQFSIEQMVGQLKMRKARNLKLDEDHTSPLTAL